MKKEILKGSNVWFTADEHYGHRNIIKYCDRPFNSLDEMDELLIANFNEVVPEDGFIIHVGDFTLRNRKFALSIVQRLNGIHFFIYGSHDRWMTDEEKLRTLWEWNIDGTHVVACHYAMRTWPGSHFGSIQVYGHSHGKLPPIGNQYDVGVDNNDYRPISFKDLREKIKENAG